MSEQVDTEVIEGLRARLWRAGFRNVAREVCDHLEPGHYPLVVRVDEHIQARVFLHDDGSMHAEYRVRLGSWRPICSDSGDIVGSRPSRRSLQRAKATGKHVLIKRNIRLSDHDLSRIKEAAALTDKGWTTWAREVLMQHCDVVLGEVG